MEFYPSARAYRSALTCAATTIIISTTAGTKKGGTSVASLEALFRDYFKEVCRRWNPLDPSEPRVMFVFRGFAEALFRAHKSKFESFFLEWEDIEPVFSHPLFLSVLSQYRDFCLNKDKDPRSDY